MKFQFCGALPCAEWFLAESSILVKITSIKLKIVCGHLFRHMIDGVDNSDKIYQTLENSGFNKEEITAILGSLDYILNNSVRYEVKDTVLLKELIDLGLPKENCESIVKAFQDNLERLKEKKLNSILKVGGVEDFDYSINEVFLAKGLGNIPSRGTRYTDIKLQYHVHPVIQTSQLNEVSFRCTKEKVDSLISELRKASEVMNKY